MLPLQNSEMDLPRNHKIYNFKNDAVDAACKSCNKYHKHGALLIKGGKVIASGWNDEHNHAEKNAIISGYRLLFRYERKEKFKRS